MIRTARSLTVSLASIALVLVPGPRAGAAVTREQVEKAIRDGVRFLKLQQRDDGSWADVDNEAHTGTTSLVTLALMTAGEPVHSPTITKALEYLRNFGPDQLNSVYAVALQTMVFAAAQPDTDRLKIAANVDWLERAQIKPGDRVLWPGSWSYSANKNRHGDNSNSQYALLGLNAASEVGTPVRREVWTLARQYWEQNQHGDGGWAYTPDAASPASASMTCAGISSLIITGLKRFQGQEFLAGDAIQNCGRGGININLQRGIDWMAARFRVGENFGHGHQWRYYYLYGLERAGRLTGQRFFGEHDWYREGAEKLVHDQDNLSGFWKGSLFEQDSLVATSFALLFLAKGRAPVLINKLRHGPRGDWNNDTDDIRNLVGLVSRDWKNLLTWQVVDPNVASVEDLLQAPIVFFNGHEAPEFTPEGKKNAPRLRRAGRLHLRRGLLRPGRVRPRLPRADEGGLPRARIRAAPAGRGPRGLAGEAPAPARYPPALGDRARLPHGGDLLARRPLVLLEPDGEQPGQPRGDQGAEGRPERGRLRDRPRAARRQADGPRGPRVQGRDPQARGAPHRQAPPRRRMERGAAGDPEPDDQPQGEARVRRGDPPQGPLPERPEPGAIPADLHPWPRRTVVRRQRTWTPCAGTWTRAAAPSSPTRPAAAPPSTPRSASSWPSCCPTTHSSRSPATTRFTPSRSATTCRTSQYSKAAGGGTDFPQLEGVKIDDHWAIIYSKYDLGCALERHQGLDCKGYSYASALEIATNIVIYSTLP